jgi:hypothetical protein
LPIPGLGCFRKLGPRKSVKTTTKTRRGRTSNQVEIWKTGFSLLSSDESDTIAFND